MAPQRAVVIQSATQFGKDRVPPHLLLFILHLTFRAASHDNRESLSVLQMNLTLSNKLNRGLCLEDIARQNVPSLHWAVRHTALDLIEMLLSSGVDINTVQIGRAHV